LLAAAIVCPGRSTWMGSALMAVFKGRWRYVSDWGDRYIPVVTAGVWFVLSAGVVVPIALQRAPSPPMAVLSFVLLSTLVVLLFVKRYRGQQGPLENVVVEETVPPSADAPQSVEKQPAIEEQLRRAKQLESLGMLAGEIAHDFNNILTAIIGHTVLSLEELPLDSPVRPSLEEVKSEAKRAADLCRQMLTYSSNHQPAHESVDLNALIRDMRYLLNISVGKKTRLEFDLAQERLVVTASPTQLRQIILNLVINASESLYGNEGVVAIRTRPGESGAHTTRLEVSDTGCGMDEYTRANMFEPFFSTKSGGRGLGMASVQSIVAAHKGDIEVLTRPGEGSTFQITLPAARAGLPQPSSPAGEQEHLDRYWRGMGTVLLVDDEKPVCQASRKMLEQMGYSVEVARDGEEALTAFQESPDKYTFVMLDLIMPRKNGEETCRELRRIRADLPILLSSGYGRDEIEKRLSREEFTDFLPKPFDSAELARMLRRTFGKDQ
jgi:two-component system, cell cycle sensor histidine kinase and response regulator CckA